MQNDDSVFIHPVLPDDRDELEIAKELFIQYANWLLNDHGISLEFQGIDQELQTLPGNYAPPTGSILLAKDHAATPLGCIALREFEGKTCEIKRLFVHPRARGKSVGRKLIRDILRVAEKIGYQKAILDTGKFMAAAQALYEEFGFTDIPAYYDNPFPDMRYMGLDLKTAS